MAKKPQLVYILTNPTMPDLVKIGRTTQSIETRMLEISNATGVPVPFECYYCCEVKDCKDVEWKLHFAFGDRRINPRREFFRVDPERAKSALQLACIRDATPKEVIAETKEEKESVGVAKRIQQRRQRPPFTFSEVGIAIGETISFYYNQEWDTNWVAKVVDDRGVEFEDERHSLNSVTKLLMDRGGDPQEYVRGPSYWLYKGETLTDRRLRMEREAEEEELDEEDGIAPRFSFQTMLEIPIGATIVFSLQEEWTAKVVDETTVEFDGDKYSLHGITQKLKKDLGRPETPAQGLHFWFYEDERLSERRKRMGK
ncbi:MAG: GIY-YIG nuclease family protein [Proteobacteria bacterium]|nr:GIY-YIG nuclease family protein [Pseudomonadota bacterium]